MPPRTRTTQAKSSTRAKADAARDEDEDAQAAAEYGEREVKAADDRGRRAANGEVDDEPDNVRRIDSGPVDFDLDARRTNTIEDYRLRFDGETWTVRQPDVDTVMRIEQAPTSEAFCQLMFEEQWDDLGPLLKAYPDATVINELARAISVHFNLDVESQRGAAAPMNRAQRRAGPPRR